MFASTIREARMNSLSNRWLHVACVIVGALALATPAIAQQGPYVDLTTEWSPVTIGSTHQTWRVDRATTGVQQDRFGVMVAGERQQRADVVDWDVQSTAFRRIGDWTVVGSGSVAPNSEFLYRYAAEGALARRVVGGLVLQGGYRYLSYPTVHVHLYQPSATWYFSRGDVEAHGFLVDRTGADTMASILLARGEVDVSRHLRLGGGAARGARIFDLAALPDLSARGWVAYGTARVVVSSRWSVTVSAGAAHEDPVFSQRTLSFGLRRALP